MNRNDMKASPLELNSYFCSLLPAFFLGSFQSGAEAEDTPSWLTSVTHINGSHGFSGSNGRGILIPITMSPLNGPVVDALRILSEYNDSYTGLYSEWLKQDPKPKPPMTLEEIQAAEKKRILEMVSRFTKKYPNHQRAGELIKAAYRLVFHNTSYLVGQARSSLDDLLAQFVALPKIVSGKAAFVEFANSIDEVVLGWPHFDATRFPSCNPTQREMLDKLPSLVGEVKSYLLWENQD